MQSYHQVMEEIFSSSSNNTSSPEGSFEAKEQKMDLQRYSEGMRAVNINPLSLIESQVFLKRLGRISDSYYNPHPEEELQVDANGNLKESAVKVWQKTLREARDFILLVRQEQQKYIIEGYLFTVASKNKNKNGFFEIEIRELATSPPYKTDGYKCKLLDLLASNLATVSPETELVYEPYDNVEVFQKVFGFCHFIDYYSGVLMTTVGEFCQNAGVTLNNTQSVSSLTLDSKRRLHQTTTTHENGDTTSSNHTEDNIQISPYNRPMK